MDAGGSIPSTLTLLGKLKCRGIASIEERQAIIEQFGVEAAPPVMVVTATETNHGNAVNETGDRTNDEISNR